MLNRKTWKFLARTTETYGPIYLLKGHFEVRFKLFPRDSLQILPSVRSTAQGDGGLTQRPVIRNSNLHVFLGPSVLTTVGAAHRRQRKLLNPVFSAAHLRDMAHIFYSVARKMRSVLAARVPADGTEKVLDRNGWMARTTLEMLGQAGLGYSFDNFVEDSTDPYGESLKMFLLMPNENGLRLVRISDTMKESDGFKVCQLEMSTSPVLHAARQRGCQCVHSISEVVPVAMLSSFAFELTNQEITWNSSGVMHPTMGEESTKFGMLLKERAL
ncbi:cytochrome P450 [Ganoderma sinense ZZ0214-1]|uniref:Cytochrome P450 n=1 Tax=Ganoderma sinense ZZ0214-1 TaxID=1077348 RepID=A0A2G8SL93_9APHY|nr:cytochrome P450 [Ganoderma sinense ZZ0214-1]